MADWCMATGMPPDVYNSLPLGALQAFIKAAAKRPRFSF